MKSKKIVWAAVAVLLLAVAGGAGWYLHNRAAAPVAAEASLAPDSIKPGEHVLGRADAPVTLVEYFAQGCSVCAMANEQILPQIKAKYIDTGKVRYAMRIYNIFPSDAAAYRLDLCVAPDKFFTATDLLFRSQPEWDSAEYGVLDPHGALSRQAKLLGFSQEQADACMTSTAHDADINRSSLEAQQRYQARGTPTFVVDFKDVRTNPSLAELEAVLDKALAAKGVK